MTVVNGNVTWFWDAVRRPMVLCTDGSPADRCAWQFNLEALPNFEAECTVLTIAPGQQVTDDEADCDRSGSVYRFTARAGERYRVDVAEGSAFIVGPDGKPENEPGQTEIAIPRDGDYYVVLDQRGVSPTVTFTPVRL